jgi:RNA polymerase sigma-70 factor (ECF subfamily)
MMDETRKSLLARLKTASNNNDWEALYEQYSAIILSFCLKQGLDEFGARDVLQETMILLMRKLPGFEYDPQKGRFRNWLLALVAGKVRDAHRRARRHQFVALDANSDVDRSLGHDAVAPAADCSKALEETWMQGLVEEALRRIQRDPKTKAETFDVFHAYVIAGNSVPDVARQFRLQENAVYQIKNRLLKRLRDEILQLERPNLPVEKQSPHLCA